MFCPNCSSINLSGKITFSPCVSSNATVDCYQIRDKNNVFQWYSKGVWKTKCFPTSVTISCDNCGIEFNNPGELADILLNIKQ